MQATGRRAKLRPAQQALPAASAVTVGAKHLGEALLQLLAREDGRRAELLGRRHDSSCAVEEIFGRLQQHLYGRFTGVESDEFDLAALLGSEFQFHTKRVRGKGEGTSIELW